MVDKNSAIGEILSPILVEIEATLWEFEANMAVKPDFTQDGFRAACKILMCVVLDKMWELQENDGMNIEDRGNMATKAGNDFRKLIKTYTGIDTHKLY